MMKTLEQTTQQEMTSQHDYLESANVLMERFRQALSRPVRPIIEDDNLDTLLDQRSELKENIRVLERSIDFLENVILVNEDETEELGLFKKQLQNAKAEIVDLDLKINAVAAMD